MVRVFLNLLYFFILPALLILIHDLILFMDEYQLSNAIELIHNGELQFSDIFSDFGFIWTEYHVESFRTAMADLTAEQKDLVTMFLVKKAIIVVPSAFLGARIIVLLVRSLLRRRRRIVVSKSGTEQVNEALGRNKDSYEYSRR